MNQNFANFLAMCSSHYGYLKMGGVSDLKEQRQEITQISNCHLVILIQTLVFS